MKGHEFIIKFNQDRAYLTDIHYLSLSQASLPAIAKNFKSPVFWKFKVLNYDSSQEKLFCDIIDYNITETEFPSNQIMYSDTLNKINLITFRHIDTSALLYALKGSLESSSVSPVITESFEYRHESQQEARKLDIPFIKIIKDSFQVALKDVKFKFGNVSFEKKINEVRNSISFSIINYDIREEFDAIKNYFANVLKTKKIEVNFEVELTNGEVTKVTATSPEISKINKDLIESVKFDFVRGFEKRRIDIEINKAFFTMDELFDAFSDERIKSNVFYGEDNDLFENLLSISNTKHYKHLRYLSSRHEHSIMKLRFILKPFSFIFLFQGEKNYHIIWETLDTEEATYIWRTEKDFVKLKLQTIKIEEIIKSIKIEGKKAYIHSTEDNYKRIYHDYSDLIEGFVKWKGELESIIT